MPHSFIRVSPILGFLFLLSMASNGGAAFQSDPPPLRFGMEIRQNSLGIEIVEIKPDRPVAQSLKKGDILRGYEIASRAGTMFRIASPSDIDRVKRELSDGETVLLHVLRRVESEGQWVFTSLIVTVTSKSLQAVVGVEMELRTVEKTYSSSPAPASANSDREGLVSVFYATDRKLEGGKYSGGRNQSSTPLQYGVCTVSIPPDHQKGRIERPKWYKFEFSEDPLKHVLIRSVSQIGKDESFRAIESTYDSMEASRKAMLVYVHGYNVSFADAAMRAAQMHVDLDFQGVTMFYSWPSNGALPAYVSDIEDIRWSTPHLVDFLRDLETRSIDDIYIISHSMGNRGLIEALIKLRNDGQGKKIKELILAAPDVDADVFNREVAPVISEYFSNATIYASSADLALWSSYALSDNPRVGEIRNGKPTVKVLPNIDVIDASAVETDFLNHSVYGDSKSIIADIQSILEKRSRPPRPYLKQVLGDVGTYWEFIPEN